MDIKSLLTPHETIEQHARIHWIVFVPVACYSLIAALAATYFHPLIGGLIFFMCLYPLYHAVIQFMMTDLILTNKKLLTRAGFLSRDWTQMTFERVENAYLEEPIIGRFLGYSTVVVSGVGSGSISVKNVINGDKFVRNLQKHLDKTQQK